MLKVLKKLPYFVYMILAKPERFFRKIVVDGSLEESMVKAFLYGLIGGLSILGTTLIFGGTVSFWSAFAKIALFPIIAVGVLFVFSGLVMMGAEITGGHRDWELAVKGTSSLFFMYPVILILDSLAFNCTSLWFLNLLIDGYVLFLLYNLAFHCMGGKKWAVLSMVLLASVLLLLIYMSDYSFWWLAAKNYNAALMCIA